MFETDVAHKTPVGLIPQLHYLVSIIYFINQIAG